MKVGLGIVMSFVYACSASAFRWTPKFESWRRAPEKSANLKATAFDLAQLRQHREYEDKLLFFDSVFADCMEAPGGKSIVPSVRKRRDMHGKTQLINPLSFKPVDIDDLLKGAVTVINKMLKEDHPFSIEKGPWGLFVVSEAGKPFS